MHFIPTVILILAATTCVYTHTCDKNVTDLYSHTGSAITEKECPCDEKVCLMKCCPFGSGYDVNNHTCIKLKDPFMLSVKDKYQRPKKDAINLFYFKVGVIKCYKMPRFMISDLSKGREFHVRMDGNLYVQVLNWIPPYWLFRSENYCVDDFVTVDEDGNVTVAVNALVCFPDQVDNNNYILSAACMLVSCGFILITVGVYLWLPKLQNVHGRVLVAYLLCLFVGFLFMATMQLMLHHNTINQEICEIMSGAKNAEEDDIIRDYTVKKLSSHIEPRF